MSAPNAKVRAALKVALVLAVLIGGGAIVFNRLRATAVVATVERGKAVDVVTGSVVVHADKDLQEIKSELPGRVAWIDPRELGQPFKAGEVIVKLDAGEFERAMKQAADDYQAQVERLKLQKQNDPALQIAKETLAAAELQYNRKSISEVDWKNAQRAYQQVETNLALADFDVKQAKVKFENDQAALQRQIDKMTIHAPMDGIVRDILVAPGALINAGTTVATFFSNQRVVIAKVGEDSIGKVKTGQPARVRLLDLPDETFDAAVTTILPFADPDTQRYTVYLEVKADAAKLRPFSSGEATITVGERDNQPMIPRRAIFNDDNVFVVKDGVVRKRRVGLGFRALNYAEVTSNLTEGEQVITDDVDQFRDGQHVKVVVGER